MATTVPCPDCGALLDPQLAKYHHDVHDDVRKLKKRVTQLEDEVKQLKKS